MQTGGTNTPKNTLCYSDPLKFKGIGVLNTKLIAEVRQCHSTLKRMAYDFGPNNQRAPKHLRIANNNYSHSPLRGIYDF